MLPTNHAANAIPINMYTWKLISSIKLLSSKQVLLEPNIAVCMVSIVKLHVVLEGGSVNVNIVPQVNSSPPTIELKLVMVIIREVGQRISGEVAIVLDASYCTNALVMSPNTFIAIGKEDPSSMAAMVPRNIRNQSRHEA